MKFKIDVINDWHIPYVKKWWGWSQISGGRLKQEDAIMEIGKYALKAKQHQK